MVSYHTGPALWLAMDAALAQKECHELIIVDNGNIPGDAARLEARAKMEPRIRLVRGQGNVGFSKGCNLGVKQASGQYVLLLNPDSMLPVCGLARALATLGAYPENTLAGCFLANPDGSEQRASRRELLTPQNAVVESLGLYLFLRKVKRLNLHGTPMPETAHEVPAISGAFMLLARAFYARLGGLDEGYFLHMEDMDFCCRVHAAGGKVIFMPEVKVIHFRSTSEVSSSFVEKHKTRGFVRYLRTHFKGKQSGVLLQLLIAGLWLRFTLMRFINGVDRIFIPAINARQEIARLVILYRFAFYGAADNSLAGKTLLITGASGQIGLCAIGKALARGAQVIAVYNTTQIPFQHPNLQWVKCDLSGDDLGILAEVHADTLIHCAALWMLPPALPALLDSGIRRVIAFGSTSVFGKVNSKNKEEKTVVDKLKTSEEDIMRTGKDRMKDVTILRPTMIYGVGLDANITRLADVARRFGFLPIYGSGKGQRHPVQAQDLAETALGIIDTPATYSKAYNVGGKQAMSYRQMLIMIFQYLGKKPHLMQLPFLPTILNTLGVVYQLSHINGEMAYRMNRDLLFDIGEAISDFGYHPHGFLEGDIIL
jgi:GT2 family glycosyltransferase/nucleoside-diphosphate-sugar epimerase